MRKLISKNRPSHTVADLWRVLVGNKKDVQRFESTFADSMGGTYGISFPYCRTAIEALLEVATEPNQTVVLPAYTCSVVAHAVRLAQREMVFVDADDKYANTSTETFLKRITNNVGALLPTHMYGNPVTLNPLETVNQNILIIEDGSLGLHPAWKTNNDQLTVATVYSFGSNKLLSTIQGGMVVTNDKDLANKLYEWRKQHLSKPSTTHKLTLWIKLLVLYIGFKPALYYALDQLRALPIFKSYFDTRDLENGSFPKDGYIAFTSMQARLGLRQLPFAPSFIKRRKAIAEKYTNAFKAEKKITIIPPNQNGHVSHYSFVVDKEDRNLFLQKLKKEGVEPGVTFDYLVTDLPLYKKYAPSELPQASSLAAGLVNIPCYPALTDTQVEHIIAAVRKSLA